jgi:hypothetical protein
MAEDVRCRSTGYRTGHGVACYDMQQRTCGAAGHGMVVWCGVMQQDMTCHDWVVGLQVPVLGATVANTGPYCGCDGGCCGAQHTYKYQLVACWEQLANCL